MGGPSAKRGVQPVSDACSRINVITSNQPQTELPSRHSLRHPAGGQTSLYLVRHGRTSGNVQQILCGRTDVPLDSRGEREAELVAARIAEFVTADTLISSPLGRARSTAKAIAARTGLEPEIMDDLAELNFGDLEGFTLQRFAMEYPSLAVRFLDFEDHDVGWPGGETRVGFHTRVRNAFEDILTRYQNNSVIVVAHGGVLGSFIAEIQGVSPYDWRQFIIRNCSITHLEVANDGSTFHLVNDTEHLAGLDDED
jgi:ribonuclease H / adenosylcobalamin/alpha-ribazole phosphatase